MTEIILPSNDLHRPSKPRKARACLQLHIPAPTCVAVEKIEEDDVPTKCQVNSSNDFATEICPGGLYLGRVEDAQNADELRRLQIGFVLNLAKECEKVESPKGIVKMTIPLEDKVGEDLSPWFEKAFDFIDEAQSRGEKVLVCCRRGISRSAAIVVGYLMARRHMTYNDAFDYVKERRAGINPNLGFCLTLASLEQRLTAH